jgi:hypothetical protein
MGLTESALYKAIRGDEDAEVIKAGTLATTRGMGVVAAALVAGLPALDKLSDTGPWHDADAATKLWFILGAGAIWAIVAAADAVARGLAQPRVVSLPTGLPVTRTAGRDEAGWTAVAIEAGDNPLFLVVKGTDTAWVAAADLHFG